MGSSSFEMQKPKNLVASKGGGGGAGTTAVKFGV